MEREPHRKESPEVRNELGTVLCRHCGGVMFMLPSNRVKTWYLECDSCAGNGSDSARESGSDRDNGGGAKGYGALTEANGEAV